MAFMFLRETNKAFVNRGIDQISAANALICYLCVCSRTETILMHVLSEPV
jgi:hypothetical protein